MEYGQIPEADLELYEILRRYAKVSTQLLDGGASREELMRRQQKLIDEAEQHGFHIPPEVQKHSLDRLKFNQHH